MTEEFKKYIGTKEIKARPCTADEADEILGRKVCRDNADELGNGYLVRYKDGYMSWSPSKAFDDVYKPVDRITFGDAIEALKRGKKVARAGWNGKEMYLAMQQGTVIRPQDARGGAALAHAESGEADEEGIIILPHIDMKSANGDIVVGWLASQTDMLLEDWMVVD